MDSINQRLIERQTTYHLLALFYRGEIGSGLSILHEKDVYFQLIGRSSFVSMIAPVISEIKARQDRRKYEEELRADYQKLFVGPGHVPAPPWASVYLTREKLLFGEPETIARQFYHSIGLSVSTAEPADHISLELAFMARLYAFARSGNRMAAGAGNIQKRFLDTHLLRWTLDWHSDVMHHAGTAFWRRVAEATRRWLLEDSGSLTNS